MAAVIYAADGPFPEQRPGYSTRWRPSIHMPRWASRLTLEITGVRVERLQQITAADCYSEGVRTIPSDQRAAFVPGTDIEANGGSADDRYRACFRQLWDSLNAKRGYSWENNPWVWVLSFTVLPHPAGARAP